MNLNDPQQDSSKWFLGVFYFNREDKRLLVPKRIAAMGWTMNFANPLSIVLFACILLLLIVVSKIA